MILHFSPRRGININSTRRILIIPAERILRKVDLLSRRPHTHVLCVLCAAQLLLWQSAGRGEANAERAVDKKQQAGRERASSALPAYPSHITAAFHHVNFNLTLSKLYSRGFLFTHAISAAYTMTWIESICPSHEDFNISFKIEAHNLKWKKITIILCVLGTSWFIFALN